MTSVLGAGGCAGTRSADSMNGATPRWVLIALAVLLCLGWGAVIWAVPHLHTDPVMHEVARFMHVAALLVGFGAVLSLDWLGLCCLLGRRSLSDVLDLAESLAVPIWAGLAGLSVSGLLLHPDLTSWPTRVKLGIVLVIGLNGLYARNLVPQLADPPSRSHLVRASVCLVVSQAGWWSTTIIGMLNAHG